MNPISDGFFLPGFGEGSVILPDFDGATVLSGGFAVVLIVIYLLIAFASMALSIVSYVLQSIGLYSIAERRGIHHSWLAWIPLGNLWVLGSISDQYQYVAKGKIKNRRKSMLWLSVAIIAVYLIWVVFLVLSMFSNDDFLTVFIILIGIIGLMVTAIVLTIVQYMAYYDLFVSCNRENAALYLVLGILVSVTLPFLVFASRKKDLGMPPRKQPTPQAVPVQLSEAIPAEEAAEPAEEGVESAESDIVLPDEAEKEQ